MNMLSDFLQGAVDRFENGQAVIKLNDGQELLWPKSKLPANIKQGAVIKITLLTQKKQEQAQQEMAKSLLNELLKKEK